MRRGMGAVKDGRVSQRRRLVAASALRRRAGIVAVAMLSAAALCFVTAAAASAFKAEGSVEQVYATGLAPGAQAALVGPKGETVSTQTADLEGGLLFRHVAPAKGYSVKLTATSEEQGSIT